MKKIILCLLGIFTLFSLSSCKNQCECWSCQQSIIIEKDVYDNKNYYVILKSGKTCSISEQSYNEYEIGDYFKGELYEDEKD